MPIISLAGRRLNDSFKFVTQNSQSVSNPDKWIFADGEGVPITWFEGTASVAETLIDNIWIRSAGSNSAVYNDTPDRISYAIGSSSIAYGYQTTASADFAQAQGRWVRADGNWAHSEGNDTLARGDDSHTEGLRTQTGTNNYVPAVPRILITEPLYNNYPTHSASIVPHPVYGAPPNANGQYVVFTTDPSWSFFFSRNNRLNSRYVYNSSSAPFANGLIEYRIDSYRMFVTASGDPDGCGNVCTETFPLSIVIPSGSGYCLIPTGNFQFQCTTHNRITGSTSNPLSPNGDPIKFYQEYKPGYYIGGAHSHAEGGYTLAIGSGSHSEGLNTVAYGDYSHAEGTAYLLDSTFISIFDIDQIEFNINGFGDIFTVSSSTNTSLILQGNQNFTYIPQFPYTLDPNTDYVQIYSGSATVIFDATFFPAITIVTQSYDSYVNETEIIINRFDDFYYTPGFKYPTVASGSYSHAEGLGTTTYGLASHAEGSLTIASGAYSHAEGYYTVTSGSFSHAEGSFTRAIGIGSHAEGINTTVTGDYSHAEGYYTRAIGGVSHAEGTDTIAIGTGAHSEGSFTTASSDWSHTEGFRTIASGTYSHAEGENTITRGRSSHAEGILTVTTGSWSHAEGLLTRTIGIGAHSEGSSSIAFGTASHAEGRTTISSGSFSHAEGSSSISLGIASHAEGFITVASGSWSHTEGENTITRATGSHAEGRQTVASGSYSHAEGSGSISYGVVSHAEGWRTEARGRGSHSEGDQSVSNGDFSHAEGDNTNSTGDNSHSEGRQTLSIGNFSHAEGSRSISYGIASHAGGLHTIASGNFQTTVGRYNIQNNTEDFFVVGDGTADNARSNALGVGLYGAEYLFYASNSVYFPDLTAVYKPHVVVFDEVTKQIFYTASSAFGGGGGAPELTVIDGDISTTYSNIGTIYVCGSGVITSTPGTGIVTMSFDSGSDIWRRDDGYLDAVLISVSESHTTGTGSVSFGAINTASGDFSLAYGMTTIAFGPYSHAEGSSSLAFGTGSHSEGIFTTASGDYSHAEGFRTIASGAYSHAEGIPYLGFFSSIAYGEGSHVEGKWTTAEGEASHAEGERTKAAGTGSHSEGYFTTANAPYSHAEGDSSQALGRFSHAEGFNTRARESGSHAEGEITDTYGKYSHAEGYNTTTYDIYTHAEGYETETRGTGSHSEGYQAKTYGRYSHTEGNGTKTYGVGAHAEGWLTEGGQFGWLATLTGSVVTMSATYGDLSTQLQSLAGLSQNSQAYVIIDSSEFSVQLVESYPITPSTNIGFDGTYTYIQLPVVVNVPNSPQDIYVGFAGSNSRALATTYGATLSMGDYSHAEGRDTYALGNASHAEGRDSISIDQYTHVEGYQTVARGEYSHAEGYQTQTLGDASHAGGLGTIASASYQTVYGRYNKQNNTSDYFVIGDGTNINNRSDALGVNNIRFYASNSIYFPDLTSQNYQHVVVFNTATGQINYRTGSDFGGGGTSTPTFPFLGNAVITGSLLVSGSHNGFSGITGSLFGTASWARSSSISISASYAVTSSFATTASYSETSSFAATASYALNSLPAAPLNSIQYNSGSRFVGSSTFTFISSSNTLYLTGSAVISGSVTASKMLISSSGNEQLKVVGSGSSNPIVGIFGSSGPLMTVSDVLTGSILSVNDISGFTTFEVFSDYTTYIGDPYAPALHTSKIFNITSTGAFKVYTYPTMSSTGFTYDGLFIEYTAISSSNARAGSMMAIRSGSNVNYTETTTTDLGNTAGFSLRVDISSSMFVLSGSASTPNWRFKSIIRAI